LDYTNYQFDLKNVDKYFYVTLCSTKNEEDGFDEDEMTSTGTRSNASFDNLSDRSKNNREV
jgi:hypothetical protein